MIRELFFAIVLTSLQGIVSSCDENVDFCFDSEENSEVCECIANCPFSTLEAAMNEKNNQFRIWTTFHHTREAFPHFLVVNYFANETSCSTNRTKQTYLWTSNSIYFVIPPHVFGFLSLFLGTLDDDHTGDVNLMLPKECSCWLKRNNCNDSKSEIASRNYLDVLTQKVCIVVCMVML